jgi:hypothetical protein
MVEHFPFQPIMTGSTSYLQPPSLSILVCNIMTRSNLTQSWLCACNIDNIAVPCICKHSICPVALTAVRSAIFSRIQWLQIYFHRDAGVNRLVRKRAIKMLWRMGISVRSLSLWAHSCEGTNCGCARGTGCEQSCDWWCMDDIDFEMMLQATVTPQEILWYNVERSPGRCYK